MKCLDVVAKNVRFCIENVWILQRRVSQPISRCVLLLGNREKVVAPSFPPGGFTQVMKDPLQHNLAQFRQVMKRISVGGKMGKEILGSDPAPKLAWIDREKQTDLVRSILCLK